MKEIPSDTLNYLDFPADVSRANCVTHRSWCRSPWCHTPGTELAFGQLTSTFARVLTLG